MACRRIEVNNFGKSGSGDPLKRWGVRPGRFRRPGLSGCWLVQTLRRASVGSVPRANRSPSTARQTGQPRAGGRAGDWLSGRPVATVGATAAVPRLKLACRRVKGLSVLWRRLRLFMGDSRSSGGVGSSRAGDDSHSFPAHLLRSTRSVGLTGLPESPLGLQSVIDSRSLSCAARIRRSRSTARWTRWRAPSRETPSWRPSSSKLSSGWPIPNRSFTSNASSG